MREEYKKELAELKTRMIKAEKFAEKLPVFAEKILGYKYTGEEDNIRFGNYYKKIPLDWGIDRRYYRNSSGRYIMNCKKEHNGFFFCIYINSISLFNRHNLYGLYEALQSVNVFYCDTLNTTFYITDDNIEAFLEALNNWYLAAIEQDKISRAAERRAKLEKELEELNSKII